MVRDDRRGEVVFCVVRPTGKIILITCEEYPQGIYRVPTGGIKYGEDIIDAVYRETKEELGLKTEISDFAGVLKIKFTASGDYEMFYSYLFVLNEIAAGFLKMPRMTRLARLRKRTWRIFKRCWICLRKWKSPGWTGESSGMRRQKLFLIM
jgi:ADP-ribose pyrophosphatase YjhB (NUDIX family)